jgi:hypothetical protein
LRVISLKKTIFAIVVGLDVQTEPNHALKQYSLMINNQQNHVRKTNLKCVS